MPVNKIPNRRVLITAKIVIFTYLFFINIFVVKSSPEIIFLQLVLLVFVFAKTKLNSFTHDWLPFIATFVLFEFLRGIADNISPLYRSSLFIVYNLEKSLFAKLPTIFFQESSLYIPFVLAICFFFYFSFYYYSFVGAFLVWTKNTKLFNEYKKWFLIMSFTGLTIFFFLPTAPPWYVSKVLGLDISRYIYEQKLIVNLIDLPFYRYLVFGNDVAAFPSLHVAWVSFTSTFASLIVNKRYIPLLWVTPLMVGFSTIILGEHFVLDIIAGYLLGIGFGLLPAKHLTDILRKRAVAVGKQERIFT